MRIRRLVVAANRDAPAVSDLSVLRILVVDPSPQILADYRRALERRPPARLADGLDEADAALFGLSGPPPDFPEVSVTTCRSVADAVSAVEDGIKSKSPFLLAFLEVSLNERFDGLQAGHAIRKLDPGLPLVVVSAVTERHPLEMAQQIPPLDLLFFLCKPFHAFEIQQMALALATRRRAELVLGRQATQMPGERLPSGQQSLAATVPAGLILFDRHDRLLLVNERVNELLPDLADVLVVGAVYEEVFAAIAERLMVRDALLSQEAWLQERLAWHAKSGGVAEIGLRRGRSMLLAEATGPLGETCCLFVDLSRIKQRDAWRVARRRVDQVVASLGEQLAALLPPELAARESVEHAGPTESGEAGKPNPGIEKPSSSA